MLDDFRPEARTSANPRSLSFHLTGLIALTLAGLSLVLLAAACGGGGKGDEPPQVATVAGNEGTLAGLADDVQPTVEATIDLNRQTGDAPKHLSSVGPNDRIVIPKFGVDAPLSYKTVGLDGVMPNPNGPDDVAYYDFSAWPGYGGAPGSGNTVMAGHVDSGTQACKNGTKQPPCEAVFWDISKLRIGDEIELRVGGASYKYRVTSNQPFPADTGPWNKIVSATARETLTLITCGGDFNRETRDYSNRQVLVAVRI